MTKTHCNECHRRAVAGPNYDPARGTGRTTRDIHAALLAAALGGKRVLYVTPDYFAAKEGLRIAMKVLEKHGLPGVSHRTAVSVHFLSGAWLEFKSMGADLEYRGIPEHETPELRSWDHHAVELNNELVRKKQRIEDLAAFADEAHRLGIKSITRGLAGKYIIIDEG